MFEKVSGVVYQYIVVVAVIGLLLLSYQQSGTFNDMLLGALIGVMTQLPAKNKE